MNETIGGEALTGMAVVAAFGVTFIAACAIGWAAGDAVFGPARVQRRAGRIAKIAVPVAVMAFVAFGVLLYRWGFG